jgi:multidrug resistance protein, MATE family
VSFLKDAKMLLRLALPLLSSRLVGILVFFAGFIMIAKLGHEEFAAGSLVVSIFGTVIMMGVGILYAIGIKISHAYGAKAPEKIREYFHSGIMLAIIIGLIGIMLLLLFSLLLPYLGQDPKLIPEAKQFLYALCLPILPGLLTVAPNQVATALLKPRIVMISSLITAPIAIGCLYLFIFGGLGIPPLKIWGFGLALIVENSFQILIVVVYLMKSSHFKPYQLFSFKKTSNHLFSRMIEIVRLGLPMGIQFGAEIAAFAVITFMIGHFGAHALSASQISSQIYTVTLMVSLTLSEATSILVGQAAGRKDPVEMRRYGFASIKLVAILLAMTSIVFIVYPQWLISIYINTHDPALADIVSLSALFLYVAAIRQIIDGVRNTITGALRGLHDSQYPMYTGIAVMWCIGLPLGILLAFPAKMGPLGFPLAASVAFIAGAAILCVRFNRKTRLPSA